MSLTAPFSVPGMGSVTTAQQRKLTGASPFAFVIPVLVSGAARDAGNTITTDLRTGLLMGKITASGKYKEYNPAGTDGSQIAVGVLWDDRKVIDAAGSNRDQEAQLMVAGPVMAAQVLLLDYQARQHLHGRFYFDDGYPGVPAGYVLPPVAKTADYTLGPADTGKVFTNQGASGAVVFTLPAVGTKGFRCKIVVEANQNVTIASPTADTLVAFNDATATSIAFSTSSEKVGAVVEIFPNADATKWIAQVSLAAETQTPTVA